MFLKIAPFVLVLMGASAVGLQFGINAFTGYFAIGILLAIK